MAPRASKPNDDAVPEVDPRLTEPYTPAGGADLQSVIEAKRAALDVASQNQAIMQSFVGWLTERATTTDEDQFALMAQITAEILEAPDMASLMSEISAVHARDVLNVPMLLHGFEIREGTFEDSQLPFYAAMTCGRPDAERTRVITCGAMKVLAKLMAMERIIDDENSGETWPQVIVFTSKQTSKGYGVLDIVRP